MWKFWFCNINYILLHGINNANMCIYFTYSIIIKPCECVWGWRGGFTSPHIRQGKRKSVADSELLFSGTGMF